MTAKYRDYQFNAKCKHNQLPYAKSTGHLE